MCEGFFTADMTLGEARRTFRKLLAECENAFVRQTPALDADVIICHFAGFSRTYLLTHEDEQISFFLAEELSAACARRLSGLPVAYITNEKEFYGRSFYVDQNVLIPKPDTELLVELAVAAARRRMKERHEQSLRIADICTGSGCIAISLLLELTGDGEPGDGSRRTAESMQPSFPSFVHSEAAQKTPGFAEPSMALDVVATDISGAALAVAAKNVRRLVSPESCSRITFLQGDLCTPLEPVAESPDSGRPLTERLFDIIVSNPPYVPAVVTDELLADGRGEPRIALDGDTDTAVLCEPGDGSLVTVSSSGDSASESTSRSSDGLAIIRRLGPQVFKHLVPGGTFFLETGEYNAEDAATYLESVGFTNVRIHKDLSGQLRVTEAHRPD